MFNSKKSIHDPFLKKLLNYWKAWKKLQQIEKAGATMTELNSSLFFHTNRHFVVKKN